MGHISLLPSCYPRGVSCLSTSLTPFAFLSLIFSSPCLSSAQISIHSLSHSVSVSRVYGQWRMLRMGCLPQPKTKPLFVAAENGPIKATRLTQATEQEESKSNCRGGSQGRGKGGKASHPRVQRSKLQASWPSPSRHSPLG